MATATQPKLLGDVLKYDVPIYSRELVTVASGQTLAMGAVLGKQTTNGKFYALNPSATDGTEVAAAVLCQDVDASTADVQAVAVVRHSVVSRSALVWPTGITSAQKDAAIGQLYFAGVLVRESA